MYLLTYETGEEHYYGPFNTISFDHSDENGHWLTCSDPVNGISRYHVSNCFEIVKENYLEV